LKNSRNDSDAKDNRRAKRSEPLEIGQEVRDLREDKVGIITDYACQYAHPKAQPVYNYLIHWQDGQIQAITETALEGEFGLTLVE
jgi:hypothetical protein